VTYEKTKNGTLETIINDLKLFEVEFYKIIAENENPQEIE